MDKYIMKLLGLHKFESQLLKQDFNCGPKHGDVTKAQMERYLRFML